MFLLSGSTSLRVRVGANQCGTRGLKVKPSVLVADGFAVFARLPQEAEGAGGRVIAAKDKSRQNFRLKARTLALANARRRGNNGILSGSASFPASFKI